MSKTIKEINEWEMNNLKQAEIGKTLYYSQEEIDKLKKALKDEIPEFTSTIFDYDLHEVIDSVFARHVQSLRSEHHDTHDGLEKEKVKDDINLSNVSSKPNNTRCTCNTCMGNND